MARSSRTFKRGHKAMGGRPKGSLNRTTIEVRELARGLIEDPEYQSALRLRMIAGTAPQMEGLLFKYAYGPPVERHEVNAEVRAVSQSQPELRDSAAAGEDHSRDLYLYGGRITQDGRERIRRLVDGAIKGVEAKAAEAKAAEAKAAEAKAAEAN